MAKRPPSFSTGLKALAPRVRAPAFANRKLASTTARGYGHEWSKLRLLVLKRDKGLCQHCIRDGQVVKAKEVDHIVPKYQGGPDDLGNLQSLCVPCHRTKTAFEGADARTSVKVIFHNHPAWFRRSVVPLTVVCGPPGSGKSAYVRKRARRGERIICFDQIATRLFGRRGQQRAHSVLTRDQLGAVLRVRNQLLADLMVESAAHQWPRAWLIVSEPLAEHRQWWADVVGADVVVMLTKEAECTRRIKVDAAGGDARSPNIGKVLTGWFAQYQPREGDHIVM